MDSRALLFVAFPLCLSSAGCEDTLTCTAVACRSGASIVVRTQNEALLPEGHIEVVLELDGETRTSSCMEDEDNEHTGGAFDGEDTPLHVRLYCGQTGMTVEMISLEEDDVPDTYRVQLFIDDVPMLDESGTFEYTTSQPNGPACGPTCRNANQVLFTIET